MPDAGNDDFLLLVVYPVESPIVADPEAVALPTGELYGVRRTRVFGEVIYSRVDSLLNVRGQLTELPVGPGFDENTVAHGRVGASEALVGVAWTLPKGEARPRRAQASPCRRRRLG